MVIKLSTEEKVHKANMAFSAVFQSYDPFDEPFRPCINKRLVLYPISYQLDELQYAALGGAARELGESAAFITETEGHKKGIKFKDLDHWKVDFGDYPYRTLMKLGWSHMMENAIYSTNGSWGLLISHEDHAVLGGDENFVNAVIANLPGIELQLRGFLDAWKYNRDRLGSKIDWLQQLLIHVYGHEKAREFLLDAGML